MTYYQKIKQRSVWRNYLFSYILISLSKQNSIYFNLNPQLFLLISKSALRTNQNVFLIWCFNLLDSSDLSLSIHVKTNHIQSLKAIMKNKKVSEDLTINFLSIKMNQSVHFKIRTCFETIFFLTPVPFFFLSVF